MNVKSYKNNISLNKIKKWNHVIDRLDNNKYGQTTVDKN